MPVIKALAVQQLHATFDVKRLPWKDSSEIPLSKSIKNGINPFQGRAMQALELAQQINTAGFNIFLSGEADLGRSYMLLSYLEPRAAKMEKAADLIYVQNFTNPDEPSLLSLPAGYGQKLKKSLKDFLIKLRTTLTKILNTPQFQKDRSALLETFNFSRSDILDEMHSAARENDFYLDLDESGSITLSPLEEEKIKNPETLSIKAKPLKSKIKKKGAILARSLMTYTQELNKIEEFFQQKEEALEIKAMRQALEEIFPAFIKSISPKTPIPALDTYLQGLKNDLIENYHFFLPKNHPIKNEELPSSPADSELSRYNINIFVDNSASKGAPIIVEDNPTLANLMGSMERESELGALVTDFTLIRAGSLQRANGGFLILHVADLLQHPQSWEALIRALRSSKAKIEDSLELSDQPIRTRSLSPEPLTLNVKVILIGDEDIYEELLYHDERFAKLFPIKAHMHDQVIKNSINIKHYLTQASIIIKEADLLPFDRSALAWLIDLGSHLSEDQKKLSLKFPLIRNYMIEASALAKSRNLKIVSSEILEEAYANRNFRANLMEEIFMEDYDRQLIKVETSGSAIGQVNGLSITMQGDFEFGLPHRISCTVGVGHDGIIDLEREADLGGPIHTKAMLILKSYLTKMFARKKPLVLNASLYFEQSYAGIEGDSASGAELVALLSALADTPVRLDLAFTGALGNSGQIMAVGGVSLKIEGFYKVCARKGLTGSQGVIIPADNMDQLMLSPEILSSVQNNRFAIYAVRNIEEALYLLTGLPAGKARKDGRFTKGSLFDLVDRRLHLLGSYAQSAFRNPRKD